MSRRIVPIPTDRRTFASAAPELDELLSFCRDSFVNGLFGPLTGQADLRVGGLRGSDSVSTRHPPLKPLSDPIPLKIQFPISLSGAPLSMTDSGWTDFLDASLTLKESK